MKTTVCSLGAIAILVLMTSFACGRTQRLDATQPSASAPAASPASAPPTPSGAPALSSSAASGHEWEGFLAEHLPSGLLYVNDANARDSTSAFEAAVAATPDAPALMSEPALAPDRYWQPSVDGVLRLGHAILADVDRSGGGSSPSYRYLVVGFESKGARKIFAKALCDTPQWWKDRVGASKLCQQVGTCGSSDALFQKHRKDCTFRYVYEADSKSLRRLDQGSQELR